MYNLENSSRQSIINVLCSVQASKIKINVGVLTPILHCVEFKGRSMRKFEKLVVLTFDEIYLNNKISIVYFYCYLLY